MELQPLQRNRLMHSNVFQFVLGFKMMLSGNYIVFALNLCLHASAELKQSQSNFQSVYKFLLELRNDSETMPEYVAKVQAIFCPERPICDLKGTRERNEILKTVPEAMETGNQTVWLEDVPNYLGVCCLPCSCSSSCYEYSNCCPTKDYATTDINKIPAITECICATAQSYKRGIGGSGACTGYFMVTKCYGDRSDMITVTKCENPNANILNDTGPVTSEKTGRIYWNRHCAICNNDADELLEWRTNVEFKHDLVFYAHDLEFPRYPNTFEELHAHLYHLSNIIYMPPSNISVKNLQCLDKKAVFSCQENGGVKYSYEGDNLIFNLCKQFYNPVVIQGASKNYPYMNIFCFFCREDFLERPAAELDCNWQEEYRFSPGVMTALLDFKTDGKAENSEFNKYMEESTNHDCACAQVYDHYQNLCRPVYCPLGEFLKECRCVQPLKSLAGMPVVLKLKVVSKQMGSFPTDEEKIKPFHQALRKLLKSTVEQITAKIVAIFKPETDGEQYYLCVVVIRSRKGHDTKETVKPFMEYLDSTRHLEYKSDKIMFAAKLTNTVLFWSETDTNYRRVFRAKVLGDHNYTLIPIYSSEEIQKTLVGKMNYQLLSPLLYCMQVELSQNEYIEKEGLVFVNQSSTVTPTPDYYRVAQGNIRICVDHYFLTSGRKPKAISQILCILSCVVQLLSYYNFAYTGQI